METESQLPPPHTPTDRKAQFKKVAKEGHVILLPSGYDIRARRADLRILMKTGKIPNSLRSILDQAINGKEVDSADIAKEALNDDRMMNDMLDFMDTLWCDCVIDPKTMPIPMRPKEGGGQEKVPYDEREDKDDTLFVDEIDDLDKQFIMNWVMGGSKDLERFREEQSQHVERVRAVAEGAVSA